MVNFKESKIYKIVNEENKKKIYIGCTTQSLRQRMNEHKRKNSKCSSIKMGNLKKCKIVLLEEFKCENRKELFFFIII